MFTKCFGVFTQSFGVFIKSCYIFFALLLPISAQAEQQLITAGVSLQEYWDDNFSRTREGVREQITLSSASVALTKKLSRQEFSARWKGTDYRHDLREDLDAQIQVGEFSWDGQWSDRWHSELLLLRDAYAVDRLEFMDKDIVKKDDAIVKIGYGDQLLLYIGARHSKQHHSAVVRERLDYDEEEVFAEAKYQTAQQSSLIARYKVGERQYPNIVEEFLSDVALGDLDFDYQQVEFESIIQLTPKTQLNSLLAYFAREGLLNDDHGALASVDIAWEPRTKLQFKAGYLLKQPAVGELSDSPSEVDRVFLSSEWQMTYKILLSMNAYYEEQQFDGVLSPERKEQVSVISPFNITFNYSENISLRLNSEWEDRESLLPYRDYTSLQGRLGVFVSF